MDQFYNGKDIFATSAGAFASIRLSSLFKLQPEVLYETKGSQHTDGVFRTHSLTTPLSIQVLTSEDSYGRVFFQAGGYYSHHFGGNISGTAIDFVNEYHNNEFGISFGIGIEVMKMVQMGIYYQKGLSDHNRQPDNRMKHETIYFQMGFMF